MHPVCEWLLMMSKHIWPMLTELCLLLVLHDWKAMAWGDSTQAAYAGKVTVNIFQDVSTAERTCFTVVLPDLHRMRRLLKRNMFNTGSNGDDRIVQRWFVGGSLQQKQHIQGLHPFVAVTSKLFQVFPKAVLLKQKRFCWLPRAWKISRAEFSTQLLLGVEQTQQLWSGKHK